MSEHKPMTAQRGLITLILCALVAVFEGYDLQAPGVAAPKLVQSLGVKPSDLGWFFSASTFGMMLGATCGGWLADRWGRKASLQVSIAIFGLFSLVTALVGSLDALTAARFFTGVGLGGTLPVLMTVVAEHCPAHRRGAAIGILYAGMPCGGVLVSALSLIGSAPEDWRMVFVVGGIAPLLLIGLLWRFLTEMPRPARIAPSGNPLAIAFGDRRGWSTVLLWTGFFLALLTLYLLLSYLPLLLIGRGLTRADASIVQMFFNLFGAIGAIVTGWLMDRGRHRSLAAGFAYFAAVAVLVVVALQPVSLFLTCCIGAALGATVMGGQSVIYGLAPGVYPALTRGGGVGLAIAVGRFGSVSGPLLASHMLAGGWLPRDVLLALTPAMLLGGVVSVMLSRRPVIE